MDQPKKAPHLFFMFSVIALWLDRSLSVKKPQLNNDKFFLVFAVLFYKSVTFNSNN